MSQVCEQGCAALCVLALRKPNNCKVIMESGGALAALQAMKTHSAEVNVQVNTTPYDIRVLSDITTQELKKNRPL